MGNGVPAELFFSDSFPIVRFIGQAMFYNALWKGEITMEKYLAHIRRDDFDQIIAVQPVSQHCRNAAAHSSAALEPVSLSASGYLAGLVHDLGKYTEVFLSYIRQDRSTRLGQSYLCRRPAAAGALPQRRRGGLRRRGQRASGTGRWRTP